MERLLQKENHSKWTRIQNPISLTTKMTRKKSAILENLATQKYQRKVQLIICYSGNKDSTSIIRLSFVGPPGKGKERRYQPFVKAQKSK